MLTCKSYDRPSKRKDLLQPGCWGSVEVRWHSPPVNCEAKAVALQRGTLNTGLCAGSFVRLKNPEVWWEGNMATYNVLLNPHSGRKMEHWLAQVESVPIGERATCSGPCWLLPNGFSHGAFAKMEKQIVQSSRTLWETFDKLFHLHNRFPRKIFKFCWPPACWELQLAR